MAASGGVMMKAAAEPPAGPLKAMGPAKGIIYLTNKKEAPRVGVHRKKVERGICLAPKRPPSERKIGASELVAASRLCWAEIAAANSALRMEGVFPALL